MRIYFGKIGLFLKADNNLGKAVQNLTKSYDRKIINESEIDKVKQNILNEIEILNQKYYRCKKIYAYWWVNKISNDWVLTFAKKFCTFNFLLQFDIIK